MRSVLFLASLQGVLLATVAQAAPLGRVPLQGQVTDTAGVPVEGTLTVAVSLVADAGTGSTLWSSSQSVAFDHGAFTMLLGDTTPLDLELFADHPDAVLRLTVDGDALDPIPLAYTPLAAWAARADEAGHATSADAADFATSAADATTLDGHPASDFLPSTYAPAWGSVTGVPAGLADGDDDTTYTAGSGLLLDGTTFSVDGTAIEALAQGVCFDTEGELTAVLDSHYLAATYVPAWSDVTGVPADLADGDDDTTYTAGTGLALDGTVLSVDAATIEGLAEGVCFDTEDELTAVLDSHYLGASYVPDWNDVANVPADLADGDDDTTYGAGAGLALDGTTFAVDRPTVEGWAVDAVDAQGAYLQQPANDVIRPSRARIERPCASGILRYTAPDGATDEIDVTGMTTGEFRHGANDLMTFFYGGTVDSALYLDITAAPGRACTLMHEDDDTARTGWYFATDFNRNVPDQFSGLRPVFELRREGSTMAMIEACQTFTIFCI